MADPSERLRAPRARLLVGAGLGALLGSAAYFILRTPGSLGAPLAMALVGALIWGLGANVTLVFRADALEVRRLGRRERIPWTEVEQVIATTVVLRSRRIPMFELTYGGGRVLRTPAPDEAAVKRMGDEIVARAKLEWIEMKIAGKAAPAAAMRPEAVKKLRDKARS